MIVGIAAVSCSLDPNRLGGVGFGSGTTGKPCRAWHFWLGQLDRAWCMAVHVASCMGGVPAGQKCHAQMPCTARLARRPKPKSDPTQPIRIRTT